jgi:hypothetical protein
MGDTARGENAEDKVESGSTGLLLEEEEEEEEALKVDDFHSRFRRYKATTKSITSRIRLERSSLFGGGGIPLQRLMSE